MQTFLRKVHALAKEKQKHIVFPEGTEERILKATAIIQKKKIAKITLVGSEQVIKSKVKELKLKIDFRKVDIIDPKTSEKTKIYSKELLELRKNKGLTKEKADETIQDMNYFGTMMVQMGDADGMVTGTTYSTADSIRPALQIIKTKEKFHKVSGVFFMILEKKLLLFADAAITVEPNSHDLVDIAIDTAETAKKFGLDPKVALLSFSTKGSAQHSEIDKIKEAISMLKDKRPDIIADGEMQVDAALVPKVAQKKAPNSSIQGNANILIFPGLAAANIAYKLVERLGHAQAIGPILQGLKKPINDLSRGCSHKDIVNVAAFTACECEDNTK